MRYNEVKGYIETNHRNQSKYAEEKRQMLMKKSVGRCGWSGTIDRLHRFEEVTLELGKTMKPLMEAGLKKIGEAFGK